MEPNYRNYAIDISILVSFLACAITGIIKWPGILASLSLDPASLPMQQMTILHDWSGLVMVLLIFVHFILHLGWLVAMTRSVLGIRPKEVKT